MESSDQVNFLFLKNPSEYFYYEYFPIYHQTLILTVLFFLTVRYITIHIVYQWILIYRNSEIVVLTGSAKQGSWPNKTPKTK